VLVVVLEGQFSAQGGRAGIEVASQSSAVRDREPVLTDRREGANPQNSSLMVAPVEQISESGCAAITLPDEKGPTDANRL
jgi:hypothetical protein